MFPEGSSLKSLGVYDPVGAINFIAIHHIVVKIFQSGRK